MTMLWPIRTAFAVLGRVAPGLAARWAVDLFFTPRGRRGSQRVSAFLAAGRPFEVTVDGERVAGWSWGSSGPNVYLVHGWAGVGGQLAAFGPALLANGFRVVTFDAPGHGVSEGRRSSIVHFAKALQAAVVSQGPAYAVIAHSLGAAATLRAITRGLAVERVILLGPTRGPRDWAEQFRRQLGIPRPVMEQMRVRSERWLGARWEEFDVPEMARGQRAPMLLFHDRNDAEVPWSDGAAIASAWPGARFVTTVGLGHRRILRDEHVVADSVAFLKGDAGVGVGESYAAAWVGRCASPGCANAPVDGGLCESCSLETSLYYRDSRQGASAA